MTIKILSSAVEDLHAGRQFYERQEKGVGDYFFDALFSDIDSLVLYAGVHQKVYGFHRLLSKRFIINWKKKPLWCGGCSI